MIFVQSGVGAVGSGLGAVGGAVGSGLGAVPGFGSTDASVEALKARAVAVSKREEAAAVRFVMQSLLSLLIFSLRLGPCSCHQRKITRIGSRRMESQQRCLISK
jgi:hypothetical protein